MYIVNKRITPIWEDSSDAYLHQGVFLPIFPNYLSCLITKNSKFFPVIANNTLNEHIANKVYQYCQ